ncbi:MAG: 16S rRNA (adenine(1518)-N(6)/adenine(1519)-N(6))-dimethyltransferase RsmA [Eubacteriales bacterium]|jgi:16S rRNA (adenine1518-N6/adenine1519-N6)-dimethyltransferase
MEQLCDPKVVRSLLDRFHFRFSKELGQNFLIDPEVPQRIAASCGADNTCGVVEIGPGFGVLTHELAKQAGKVVAIEIDQRLPPILAYTLREHQNVKIVSGDVLKLDLPQLLRSEFGDGRVCVCANLPYYITTPIIMALLEKKLPVESITVMVQKEVAQRLCAAPGEKEAGAISAAVHYYTRPQLLFTVPPQCFMPAPKVESAVIRLEVRERPPVEVRDEKLLFDIVRGAFAQRRKTFVNSLASSGVGVSKEQITEALRQLGLPENIRGERLTLEQLAAMTDFFGGQDKSAGNGKNLVK